MYSLILAMELRLQTVLQQSAYSRNIREDAIASIMECDEVKYHWNTLSANWETEEVKGFLTYDYSAMGDYARICLC